MKYRLEIEWEPNKEEPTAGSLVMEMKTNKWL